ncbi:MAG: hypothetical protein IJP14_01095, partial [Clostridia bacterium]|nr:hypothetical protein [Clostridia bacterium]
MSVYSKRTHLIAICLTIALLITQVFAGLSAVADVATVPFDRTILADWDSDSTVSSHSSFFNATNSTSTQETSPSGYGNGLKWTKKDATAKSAQVQHGRAATPLGKKVGNNEAFVFWISLAEAGTTNASINLRNHFVTT